MNQTFQCCLPQTCMIDNTKSHENTIFRLPLYGGVGNRFFFCILNTKTKQSQTHSGANNIFLCIYLSLCFFFPFFYLVVVAYYTDKPRVCVCTCVATQSRLSTTTTAAAAATIQTHFARAVVVSRQYVIDWCCIIAETNINA